ncbi:Signal transduction histidine kinase [Fodinibius roseus]|uniref:histidine kinase n=1 Tax=Fodinibius roseus TaxID=1194090 RepID=A0A1M4TIH6_9BACT|nr:GAF domain-containing protein [Fodinibius roseus]SHE44283.1 Signal transduction histidine kinase [Fodinibius roseus]
MKNDKGKTRTEIEPIKQQRYHESLATLGVYALEQDDLEAIMHRAVQQTCMNLEVESTFIAQYNPEQDTLKVVAETGCECKELKIINDAKWDLGYALQSGKPVCVNDYTKENRFIISPILKHHDFKSSVLVAVRGTEETYGVFGFYTLEKRSFSESELNFIQMAANIVAVAIERKKTQKRLKKTNAQLREEMKRSRQYQKDILKNNIIERWELGGYLHDNLGQMLASAKIIIHDIENKLKQNETGIAEQIVTLNSIIDKGIEGIRNLTHDIIPVDIEKEGVEYAFHFLMRQTQKLYDINCMLKMNKIVTEIKNRKMATHLYHVVQEAIKNAVMHGAAKNITVTVRESDDNLILKIADDGIGISNKKQSNGKGLRIIKHRMDLLGGTFDIEDISDDHATGARVTITLPLEKLKEEQETEDG